MFKRVKPFSCRRYIKLKVERGKSMEKNILAQQKAFFHTGKTKALTYRLDALYTLRSLIKKNENSIAEALQKDLRKSFFDSFLTEIAVLLEEIKFTIKHVKKWSRPAKVKSSLTTFGSKSMIYPEPYGNTLIIAPWNYPFQLAIAPLIGAIAAGNTAVIKPSELTPHTSRLIAHLIEEHFPAEYITVVEGGVEVSEKLLEESWDHIFFTGSVAVGRHIMKAAANHLTPVTLELGGKSPAIIHHDAQINHAAKRLVWGKFLNAGQTCVAPDFVYVHQEIHDKFLKEVTAQIESLYGENAIENTAYTKIVNEKHFKRLATFLTNGQSFYGGRVDESNHLIEPTILTEINWQDPIMQDEIFGPILPVLSYKELDDVISKINEQPKPLALYLFSDDKKVQQKILQSISFGGGCINDTVMHLSSPHLPFGGVGNSGIGSYHGRASFDAFTHYKSVLKQTTKVDFPFRYPSEKSLKLLKKLIK
ncbi:aldehyde dehydrogenase [Cytobacillus kochii]|uniref:aldehyde dehydrogenase n=1 Tax=Cytobacillus kochii TaxID=859143 RepID=UPI00247FEF5C|nr:aldehyde dehydrogenase [Cytobacillus kochii]